MPKPVTSAALWRQFPVRYRESRSAKLVTWSMIYAAPKGYEEFAPYAVGIVEFDDGKRTCVQITDVPEDELQHGVILRPVFRRMHTTDEESIIPYGTKYTI